MTASLIAKSCLLCLQDIFTSTSRPIGYWFEPELTGIRAGSGGVTRGSAGARESLGGGSLVVQAEEGLSDNVVVKDLGTL